ncbi:MAG: carbon-nitrogen hydrolase [Muribaculaceae bacterium]|nr:carbon-nitrogen hydrolase [Muribaculaceae bacterium]
MEIMKIGIIQQKNECNTAVNRDRIASKIAVLAKQGAELIALQELHDSLYFCQTEDVSNFDLSDTIPGKASDFYCEVAKRNNAVLVTSLFEKRTAGLHHNTAVVIEKDGTIVGKYRKMHIPDDPAYYEKFYFTPGDLGFEPVNTSVGRLGVMVCWDQWYPEAARIMALKGAQILIYPTAIGWESSDTAEEQDRQTEAWVTIQRSHAIANGIPVVAVNRVGTEIDPTGVTAGINFWGNSFVAGPQGEMLYKASKSSEDEHIVDVDLKRTDTVRHWWPFMRDRRIDAYNDILKRYSD